MLVVVDDNDMSCYVTARMLAAAGFLVLTAASGDEALRIVENDAEVQLVVADVCMPGMNGLELAKQLRQSHPALPVLFMSGAISGKLVPALSGPFLQNPFPKRICSQTCAASSPTSNEQYTQPLTDYAAVG